MSMLCLQDCMVGLLFAFMPVLASNSSAGEKSDHLDVAMVVVRCATLDSTHLTFRSCFGHCQMYFECCLQIL